jgi:hypothetical protein
MNRSKTGTKQKNDKVRDNDESCSQYVLRLLKEVNQAITYRDFETAYAYGTYRNTISILVRKGKVIKLPKEYPARFILPEWAHRLEYFCALRNDNKGRVGRFDFLSYLLSLGWDATLCVHDLKLSFFVYQFRWVGEGQGWEYCKGNHSYRRTLILSYPVKVQCFDTGTVLVNVECSAKPFPLDLDGLIALSNLLGEVKASLDAPCIPEVSSWNIIQWHLNRDSEKVSGGGGQSMNLTFNDFFEDSAQFYYKRNSKKYRAEVIQNPDKTIKQVFEEILYRDNFLGKKSTNGTEASKNNGK